MKVSELKQRCDEMLAAFGDKELDFCIEESDFTAQLSHINPEYIKLYSKYDEDTPWLIK